jgi:hypothetical protein
MITTVLLPPCYITTASPSPLVIAAISSSPHPPLKPSIPLIPLPIPRPPNQSLHPIHEFLSSPRISLLVSSTHPNQTFTNSSIPRTSLFPRWTNEQQSDESRGSSGDLSIDRARILGSFLVEKGTGCGCCVRGKVRWRSGRGDMGA